MCDRIAIMNHGRLIALEPTGKLLQELGTRRILVHLEEPVTEVPENLYCQGAALINDGSTLQLTLSANQPTGELLKNLCNLGLPIADIETRAAGLEEVFLQITQAGREKS